MTKIIAATTPNQTDGIHNTRLYSVILVLKKQARTLKGLRYSGRESQNNFSKEVSTIQSRNGKKNIGELRNLHIGDPSISKEVNLAGVGEKYTSK